MVGPGMFDGVLQGLLMLVVIIAVVLAAGAFFIGKAIYKTDKIESKTLIVPEKKLIIRNNQVDTLYIYRKP